MSTLADLVLADSSDAQAIVASDYPLGEFTGVNVDGLNPLHIATLHALRTGGELEQLAEHYKPMAQGSAEGPWLIRIPGELIEQLPHIAPQDVPAVAKEWAAVGQPLADGWTQQTAEAYLAQLVHFARTAAFEGKELYLCAYD